MKIQNGLRFAISIGGVFTDIGLWMWQPEHFVQGSGIPVRIPVIEMIEIGAEGGSIVAVEEWAAFRSGRTARGQSPAL